RLVLACFCHSFSSFSFLSQKSSYRRSFPRGCENRRNAPLAAALAFHGAGALPFAESAAAHEN
ncbi:hypothetical protein, partial [Ellagibacter isourolithinifaciens]|uniref:hypothetical protein n=1 Tax=Ellagibacter isourolithinifaciens TaxID=2137581 RepID=UPI003AB0EAE9